MSFFFNIQVFKDSQPNIRCICKSVRLCKQTRFAMVGWTLQHSWIELWRVWWQSVAIVSSPSLILSPSYAASMPYQAPPASLRHQCCACMLPYLLIVVLPTDLLINSFYPKEWKDDATSQWQTFGCNANAETQQSFRALIKIMTYEIRETLKLFTNTKTKFNGCFPKNTQRHKISSRA